MRAHRCVTDVGDKGAKTFQVKIRIIRHSFQHRSQISAPITERYSRLAVHHISSYRIIVHGLEIRIQQSLFIQLVQIFQYSLIFLFRISVMYRTVNLIKIPFHKAEGRSKNTMRNAYTCQPE